MIPTRHAAVSTHASMAGSAPTAAPTSARTSTRTSAPASAPIPTLARERIWRAARAGAAAATWVLAAGVAVAQVGLTQVQLDGLPVTLVYPTDVKATRQTFGAFEIEVAVDAAPAAARSASGRRPLVVTSHGTAGSPLPDHGVAAALARAGFVVAQPLHAGDNWRDASKAGPEAWRSRPVEVLKVIDGLAAHPQWGAQLQLDRVGVHGTSAGGGTALALAGAQWSTLSMLQHCNTHLEADLGFCLTGAAGAEAQARRRAQYESVRGVPEKYLPASLTAWHGGRAPAAVSTSELANDSTATRGAALSAAFDARPDARIVSVSLSVPVAAIFSAESLSRVRVPVGLVAAQADQWLLPAFHSGHVTKHCGSCTVLADLPGATHFDVMHPWPASVAAEVARTQPRGVAGNPAFDSRQRDEAYARVVQFHLRHLAAP